MDAILTNVIIILCLSGLGWLFANHPEDRTESAFWVFVFSTAVSFWGWVIFIAHHFIVKYW
jgi:membrane-bound acyltransferase YfiQ involved in biofilm formation